MNAGWRAFVTNDFCLAALSLFYVLACRSVVAQASSEIFDDQRSLLLWPFFIPPIAIGLLLALCFHTLVIERPAHPTRTIISRFAALRLPGHLVPGALGFFFIAPIIFYFGQMKSLMDYLAFCRWDETFRQIDLWLGAGNYPHTYFSWLVETRLRYEVLSAAYHPIWVSCCLALLAYALFVSPPGERRSIFLLSFASAWILIGTVVALALNSGGPVFFELYTGTNEYAALVEHLAELTNPNGLGSFLLAEKLAAFKKAGIAPPGFGISAMPSMHVSIACLTLLRAWHAGVWARTLASCYLLAIFVGSIVLGWHYAADGLVAIALTLFLWRIATSVVRMQRRILEPRLT
ncbi:membrane-associated phospholipid phosphatase [Salinisphaera dokdonensis CL-ES53]|uniref:Membrane-associated phospholipid phosphatase n=1 Tax=Salinisphaera dokdonensis CL-ES53 TaxID=1304272 RepID=A0ABV2AY11_9GAMM